MSFPDAEAMARTFLLSVVSPVKVVTQVPATRPDKFVREFRTGGAAINRVLERVQITVQGWAMDSVDAFDLTSGCREAFLNNYTLMPLVRGVSEIGGLHFDPDPGSGVPRYTFTVELMVRASR